MNRNMYDTDVTVWTPQGRLMQVTYAMESVNKGSTALGLKSKDFVVIGAIRRASSELSDHQKKIMKIDEHMGITMSGLTADARTLAKYMRTECLNHKYVYGSVMQAQRLVIDLADKHQRCTQTYIRRPYGVGMLLASYDATGAHLFQTCPSGNYYDCMAMAIGSRCQSAKTYLERHHKNMDDMSSDDLIKHALKALSSCVSGEKELDKENAGIAIVGKDQKFKVLSPEEIQVYLDSIDVEGDAEAVPMDTES